MKQIIISIMLTLLVYACTQNSRVKNWGGEGTMLLPKNRKLVNITWKEGQLWYLTRSMNSTDSAEVYTFHEESSWGVIEGTYTIIETKTLK